MKNQRNKKWLLWTVLLFFTQMISAQQQVTINGSIVDENYREPVIGASVVEKGTNKGVISDAEGNFSITVAQGATISISYIGFVSQEIVAGGNETLNIIMKEYVSELSDVVVTGYAAQKKADLTGAVSVVKVSDVKSLNTGNIIKALQGRIPGVYIKNSGNPGGNVDIKIRGASTLGNSNPMYVIDGIPTTRNLSEISMEDIESVQVLKDAS
ncbi:MAG: TonB-dependent receptor plug domain-containing protein, partial [Tannerellaceae bacterium]|nr:TonB-dependent receptor plug domain-containing protein [Tannerellaceae bacterium]